MRVLVINRDSDTDRWAGFCAAAEAQGITSQRLSAIDAHVPDFDLAAHRDLIGTHFWGQDRIKPGAVGCFLSHRAAWAEVAEGTDPRVLICEDDAQLTEPLDRLDHVAGGLPGFDAIFANDRLAAWASITGPGLHPLKDIVARLAAAGGPRANGMKPAPGGDCYLLSRQGAARLLEMTVRQRIVCGVDWAMVWSALAAPPTQGFPELAMLAAHLPPEPCPLDAYILTPGISTLAPVPSVLGHKLTVPIAPLQAR